MQNLYTVKNKYRIVQIGKNLMFRGNWEEIGVMMHVNFNKHTENYVTGA